uniref:Uncharacterized protein n=1 Tax=Anguilla anguilla TaxID=7936 RepID=A0A0E9T751_ANGAN
MLYISATCLLVLYAVFEFPGCLQHCAVQHCPSPPHL